MKRTYGWPWIAVIGMLLGYAAGAMASVVVTPASVQVALGGQVQFNATGSADGIVLWSISGAGCDGVSCGFISSSGLYTAPATPPKPSNAVVTATSLADLSQSGTAQVAIGAPVSVSVLLSPTYVTLSPKGQQQFAATVSGTSNKAVSWMVSGTGCVSGSCGTITAAGLYTAPATVPSPALATVTATSAADPTKSESASVVIQAASAVSVTVSPKSAQAQTGGQVQFAATVTGSTNTSVKWTVNGPGTISGSGLYTAPSTLPSPASATVVATAVASPSATASASVSIVAAPALSVMPSLPQVKIGGQVQFSTAGSQGGVVIWSISGSGCAGIACGMITSGGLYTAPAQAPNPATITVTATLLSNQAIQGSTTVTILAPTTVTVSVSPSGVDLNIGARQQFTASVTGASNTAVTWSVSGYGCVGAACGTITANGLYTAPSSVPNPSIINVTATSVAAPAVSRTVTVTVNEQIAVSISPISIRLAEGHQQQFTAKVTGATNTGVSWTVNGSGCTASNCGTISLNGLYTAPDNVPSPPEVQVTATSVADQTTSASATVTILLPITVTVSPASAQVAVSTQQQFRTTVTGTTNTAVTWSVTGTGCSGTSCGTVNAAGLYTAPAVLPSSAVVTVKATSEAQTASFGSAAVTLVPSNNSKLTGHYAFFFTGSDRSGVYEAAGSLTADGNGHFTAGEEDVNTVAGPATKVPLSGTYQVGSNNLGTMTLNSSLGTHVFKFSLNLLGTKGRFISFDQSGVTGSGSIERQDLTAFDPSVLGNGYVLSLAGVDVAGARVGALGLIFPDGSSFVSGSSLDVNDGGSVAPTYASFAGVYTVASTGRGTLSLSIPGFNGNFGGASLDFAFYVVSANEFLIVSVDPLSDANPILGGQAQIQNGAPFTTASFNGAAVFGLSGMKGSSAQDMVGRALFDGHADVTINFDENSAGNVTIGNLMTGAYDVELNGRGTFNMDNAATGASTVWYLYATGPNQGFIMDASTPSAAIGELDLQKVTAPFSNADLIGTYSFGSGEPVIPSGLLVSGVSGFDGSNSVQGQGVMTGTQNASRASTSTLNSNQALAGTYSISSVSNNGRGTVLFTTPSGKSIALWVVSASEALGLNIDSTTPTPTVLHYEQ